MTNSTAPHLGQPQPIVTAADPGEHSRSHPAATPRYRGDDAFHKVIRARVNRYFALTGRSPRDCPQMYLKTAIILAWLAASYILLVFFAATWWQAIPLALSLGWAMAAVGFNVQHDAGHRAYSNYPWINRLLAKTLDLLGGSSYFWDHKHNTLHHTFANITGHDDDIDVGLLARFSPHQPRLAFHRLQHLYIWFLYGFLAIKWQLIDDFWHLAIGRIGQHRIPRPRGRQLAVFIGGKVASLSLAFLIPALLHPIWTVLLLYVITFWINGLCLSLVFQLAHVVEPADFPMPDQSTNSLPTHWAVHQVNTTVNFSRRNPVLSWLLGGLNFQIEHHLFPRICHVHYPRIARLVENACQEFGLRYNAHRTFLAGLASHYRLLQALGRPTA